MPVLLIKVYLVTEMENRFPFFRIFLNNKEKENIGNVYF